MIKSFITALTFLTVVPFNFKGSESNDTKHFGLAMAMFPLVGGFIGLILFTADYFFINYFSEAVSSALILLILFIVTAGLHADGFMDTVDGIVGSKGDWDKEKIFKIMSDPNTGAAASAAFTLLMIFKWTMLVEINIAGHFIALIFMTVTSRWVLTVLTYAFPYAKISGMGSAFKDSFKAMHLLLSLTFALTILIPLAFYTQQLTVLVLVAIVTAVMFPVAFYFKRKLGGVTGDILGFTCEISEVVFLLVYIATF